MISGEDLFQELLDARRMTLELVSDLEDEQLLGPRLEIVNPLLWEIGHVAWFQERWVLRHLHRRPPLQPEVDSLYDSTAIDHDLRWELPLFSRAKTLAYMQRVLEEVGNTLQGRSLSDQEAYFYRLALFHEDMHTEAFTYTRQTLAYPPPPFLKKAALSELPPASRAEGDVEVPGGVYWLGALPGSSFVFDNEKWAHPVSVKPFRIARTAVTNAQFLEFVQDGGYHRREFWDPEGWRWRREQGALHPLYWREREGEGWFRRVFDSWVPLEPDWPVLHVNWFEAQAYCRWAGRRLPTEAEWELAATWEEGMSLQELSEPPQKRLYPWGEEAPDEKRANLDARRGGCVSVHALAPGDSPAGCRQLIGNVWEWTSSPFQPYPGFVPDPYKEYSQPWFGTHRVLRGGCWCTRSRLIRNTWRNFYRPERRDVWAGFRTCGLDED